MQDFIYLDYQATTPTSKEALSEMLPFFNEVYGNPSVRYHEQGVESGKAVEIARRKVARLIGAKARELIFTSGATESNFIALLGLARTFPKRRHIITTAIEHRSVLANVELLKTLGYSVTVLPVSHEGIIEIDALKDSVQDNTLCVSVMWANNEMGSVQPISEISAFCQERKIPLHVDAAQSIGKISLNLQEMPIDLLTLSSHKMYGPKGVGALFIRSSLLKLFQSPVVGGSQEQGLRAGTLNVPGIVGFGKAAEQAHEFLQDEPLRLRQLARDFYNHLKQGLHQLGVETSLNGPQCFEKRLPGNLNMLLRGVDAETLLMNIQGVACSSGAACASASREPSYVLRALGLTDREAKCSIRLSVGRSTTEQELQLAVGRILDAVKHVVNLGKMENCYD